MILLDTNVVSDGLKLRPNAKIQDWLDAHEPNLWISSVTIAELLVGIELLPEGRKKAALQTGADQAIDQFGGQCVPFDALAAYEFARLIAARRRIGRPIDALDAQLAAIALSTGFSLATLNTRDFEGIEGLKLIDPSE